MRRSAARSKLLYRYGVKRCFMIHSMTILVIRKYLVSPVAEIECALSRVDALINLSLMLGVRLLSPLVLG